MDRADVERILAAGRPPRLNGARLAGSDLSGLDLTDADLMYADLTGARLDRAVLRGARLFAAVLRSASLVEADLSGADLTAADLAGADLRGARLESADQPPHGGTMPQLTPHLTETDDGAQLRVSVGQAIEIALGEGTTGYQWRDDSPADQPLVLSSSDFAPPTQTAAGAFGQRHFRFEAVRPGPAAVHLVLQQPWDLDSAPDRTFEVGVEVSP